MRTSRIRNLTMALVTLALMLVACAPAAAPGAQPLVAVINGPAEGRIGGSAALLVSEMRAQGPLPFAFVSPAAMRFAEGHSDLFYDRAVPASGRIGRSYGAAYSVLIGAPGMKRDVTVSTDGDTRTVDVTVQVQAIVVDTANDSVLARFEAPLMQRSRRESTAEALPSLQFDPAVVALRDEGVGDVAPAVVGALRHALQSQTAGS